LHVGHGPSRGKNSFENLNISPYWVYNKTIEEEISRSDGLTVRGVARTQGSFLKRMPARVFLGADARNQECHFDGCTQRTFGQRMRARYVAIPGCVQPTSRMHATPLNWADTLLLSLAFYHASCNLLFGAASY